jgi:hypothetical protein
MLQSEQISLGSKWVSNVEFEHLLHNICNVCWIVIVNIDNNNKGKLKIQGETHFYHCLGEKEFYVLFNASVLFSVLFWYHPELDHLNGKTMTPNVKFLSFVDNFVDIFFLCNVESLPGELVGR